MTAPAVAGVQSRPAASRSYPRWVIAIIFIIAFVLRLWVAVGDGGLSGNYYYDPAVYYAAADALTHGLTPYHDFVLVHPPMIAIVTTPFAILGRLTSDQAGFVASNLAYTALGAVNAVLVMRVAGRFGCSPRAAITGALLYAVWTGTITAEFLTRLEPLGNFFLLLALLALSGTRGTQTLRPALACGVLLGCLVNVKIWWAIAFLVILAWLAIQDRAMRRAAAALAAATIVSLLVDGPFYVIAGNRMFRAIIVAQLQRDSNGISAHTRIDKLSGLSQLAGDTFDADSIRSNPWLQAFVVLFCLLLAAAGVLAWQAPLGKAMVVLLVLETVVFLVTPTWFYTYSDFLAVPLALTVASAATGSTRRSLGAGVPAGLTAFAALVTVITFAHGGLHMVARFHGTAALRSRTAGIRCIVSDTPMTLIRLDALDRSFDPGCTNWVDLTGVAHGGGPDPADFTRIGQRNPRYSADLCRYFTAGDAVVITPGSWQLLTPQCVARIRTSPVIARSGTDVVYRIRQ